MHAHTQTRSYARTYVCMHISMHVYKYVCASLCVCLRVCVRLCDVRACIYVAGHRPDCGGSSIHPIKPTKRKNPLQQTNGKRNPPAC